MDRNQRSRNQKKSVPPRKGQPSHRNTKSAPPQRSSRPAGSQQRPKGSGQRPAKQPERQPPKQQQKRPRPQQNPQKPGYRSSAPQVQRRVTRAEQLRIRRRKAIIGVLCVLAVLVVGIVLSINLLFKVTDFRVENADRTTPANTGIYTEQQLIDATGIQVGDNLYGFSTKEKSDQLLAQMPYLDVAVVTRQAPGAAGKCSSFFKGIIIFDWNNLIVNRSIQCVRNKSGTDSLNFMRSDFSLGKNRTGCRFYCNNVYGLLLLFQIFSNSGYGSTGSDSCHKNINAAFCLFPDFRSCGFFMGFWICRIFKLS